MTAPIIIVMPGMNLEAEVARQVRAWRTRIGELPGVHAAIEALWDAGRDGWRLDVNLVTAGRAVGGEMTYYSQSIATLRYDGDLRFCDGALVWPEAAVACGAGVRVAGDLGLDFYFPSPAHADNDCPHWWERARARPCRLCGKPLVRDDVSSRLSAQCFHCRLEEQVKRSLIADALGSAGDRIGYVVLEAEGAANDRPVRRLSFNLGSSRGGAVARVATLLRRRRPPVELSEDIDALLEPEEVASMRDWCQEAIESHLGSHVPADHRDHLADHFADHFGRTHTFIWYGQEQAVQAFLNPGGEEIDTLLGYHAYFAACVAEGGRVLLFGNGGVTHRDLRFLRYLDACDGASTVADLCAAYPFLAPEAIEKTLTKLGRRRFIARDGQSLRLLSKGMVVDIAGP